MTMQEEKETSLKYFYERVLKSFNYSSDEYYAITEAFNEAREKYDNEIKESFEKGYEEGVQYVSKFNRKENGFPF